MKIVCIGDSLTFGYGIRKDKCWASLLKEETHYTIINKGVNGDTSVGILSRFYTDVISFSPQLCIIMCGSNDILAGKDIDTIIDNISLMIKDCNLSGVVPLIMSPPKVQGNLASLLWSNDINYDIINYNLNILDEKLKHICSCKDINFISLYNSIPSENTYYTDGIHISEYSNEFVFNILKEKLALLS